MHSCMFLGKWSGCLSLSVLLLLVHLVKALLVGLFVIACMLGRVRCPEGASRHCLQGSGSFVLCGLR